jgi:hypothetical protein
MSQILPDELENVADEGPAEDPNAPAAFHGALNKRPALETSHAILTRTTWVRRTIEQALEGREVETIVKPNGEIALVLDGEGLPRDILGYDLAPRAEYKKFELWGMSGKMQCPTWDLTAGPPSIGGTCPAASAGQSVCEPHIRKTMLKDAEAGAKRGADQQPVKKGQLVLREKMPVVDGKPVPVPFYEGDEPAPNQWRTPICQYCYASAGNYRGMNVAVGGIIRYHWTKHLVVHDPDLWVRTVVASMKQLDYPLEGKGEDGILPVRIHSAGDFYDPRYAEAWIRVANELYSWDPRIVMWAPTRSWATPNWAGTKDGGQTHWERLLDPDNLLSARKGSPRLNFVVRASAYHVGDEAPGKLHPTNCVGTSSVFRDDNRNFTSKQKDPRFDIDCPVYNVERDAKTCQWAYDPTTNKLGCRACWRYLDKRVNFTTH